MGEEIKLADFLKLLAGSDRLRIIKGDQTVFAGYMYLLSEEIKEETMKKFRAVPEIRHKEWKERGLIPPMEPDITPAYSFSDLEMKLYYDIDI